MFDNVKPIIVSGVARSGTRMVTDILNTHESISIQEEMHAKTIEAYFEFVKLVDSNYKYYSERKGKDLSIHWSNHKSNFTHSFFSYCNKKEFFGNDKDNSFFGIKTPGFERYFEDFEYVFEQNKPIYVYCMRDVGDVWRSWKSIGYLSDVELFATRYRRSLRQAIKIKTNASSRFILFDLEKFKNSFDKNSYVNSVLFSNISLEPPKNGIDKLENRNSIKNKGSKLLSGKDIDKEIMYLLNDDKIISYKNQLKD